MANNSYARGIVLTLANDVVGTGPRLQMLTPDAQANSRIEREFAKWATAAGLADSHGRDRDRNADDNSHHPDDNSYHPDASDSPSGDYPDSLDCRTFLSG